MFFRDIYRPIPPIYNLVLALLWRHPENIDLEQVKVVHYCAAVSIRPRASYCTYKINKKWINNSLLWLLI